MPLLLQAEALGAAKNDIGGNGIVNTGGTADAAVASASADERRRCPSCGGRLGLKLRCVVRNDNTYHSCSPSAAAVDAEAILQVHIHCRLCAAAKAPSSGAAGIPTAATAARWTLSWAPTAKAPRPSCMLQVHQPFSANPTIPH